MQTKLKGDLFKLGLHPDGICINCSSIEDCVHFILYCKYTEQLRTDIRNCSERLMDNMNYQDIVSDPKAMDIIVNFILKNDIVI